MQRNRLWLACILGAALTGCFDNSAKLERERREAEQRMRVDQMEDDLRRLQAAQQDTLRGLDEVREAQARAAAHLDQKIALLEQGAARPEPARAAAPAKAMGPEEASVARIQDALKRAGYDPGASDGKMGQKTKNALMAFQKDNGLKADGVLGPQTLAKLQKHLGDGSQP